MFFCFNIDKFSDDGLKKLSSEHYFLSYFYFSAYLPFILKLPLYEVNLCILLPKEFFFLFLLLLLAKFRTGPVLSIIDNGSKAQCAKMYTQRPFY